jgi:SPP1 gp7 family putative phage head morphogenesis protein
MTPKNQLPSVLFTRGLPAALAVVHSVRREVSRYARSLRHREPATIITRARQIVAAHEPVLALTMRDSLLLAWLSAAQKLTDGAIVTPDLTFNPHPSRRPDEKTILIDPAKLDPDWRKDQNYYIPENSEAKPGARAEVERFFATGKPIEASRLVLDSKGAPSFIDGRHRFSVLRDRGVRAVAVTVPKKQAKLIEDRYGAAIPEQTGLASLPPLRPPFGPPIAGEFPEPVPVVKFPAIERAAKDLRDRRVLTQAEFNRLDQDARRTAFTVARIQSLESIQRIREAVAEDVEKGGTLKSFRESVANDVDGELSSAQVETVYRTQVASAYSAGQRALLDHPLVSDAFPYLLWSATHDSRVRPEHLAMEKHGQNGTAVYRADDPMWVILYPPASWNCRCVAIALSIADAAKHGSKEAQRWLRTGVAPASPLWASKPYPIIPPPGWPVHTQIGSIL